MRNPTRHLFVFILMIPLSCFGQSFEYFGEEGPAFWGELSSEWAICSTGTIQSPVNIGQAPRPKKLSFNYRESTGSIFNNGHTIEVEVEHGNLITLDKVEYELEQFHFHLPSEHRVKGRGFDMELHVVHKSHDGALAVVGIFLRRGKSSGALASIFAELPNDVDVHHSLSGAFNPLDFLPKSQKHFKYRGSLTTPPCTEGVQWIVLQDSITVADEDVARFAQRIHFNARPVQRKIKNNAAVEKRSTK